VKAGPSPQIVGAVPLRAQADALEIEAGAKRRLADEYDAAQKGREVASQSFQTRRFAYRRGNWTHLQGVHEARAIRDAEEEDPG
jgi:hypothetical protein